MRLTWIMGAVAVLALAATIWIVTAGQAPGEAEQGAGDGA